MKKLSIDFDNCLNTYTKEIVNYIQNNAFDEIVIISSRNIENKYEIKQFLEQHKLENIITEIYTTNGFTNKLAKINKLKINTHIDDDEGIKTFIENNLNNVICLKVPEELK